MPIGHAMLARCRHLAVSRWAIGAIAGTALSFLSCSGSWAEYLLSPGNVVDISVYGLPDLQRKAAIAGDGQVSFPLLGDVRIGGLTIASAREKIQNLLSTKGIINNPDVTIAIVEYPPFYIFGDVDKPGQYPFRPNLTVLQALSLAGGLYRATEQRLLRTDRDAIVAQGELNILVVQINQLTARKARLQAELSRLESIEFPRELKDKQDPALAIVMQQEQAIFEARRDGYSTQVQALTQLKNHFEKEIESLNAQLKTEETQMRLLQKELSSVASLVEKGLAVTPRQLSLERTMAQLEGDRLRLAASIMRSRQEISKTDIAILELGNKRSSEITIQLRETQSSLDEAVRKYDTSTQLLNEAESYQAAVRRAREFGVQPTFVITRMQDNQSRQLSASGTTYVEPGDTIQVDVPLPSRRPTTGARPYSVGSTTNAASTLRSNSGQARFENQ
jgi:protein involved in polysaccharide export with SLBB domain